MDLVEQLREKLTRCSIAVAMDYTGMSVNAMTDFRSHMRQNNVECRVIKNTLAYLAADSAGKPQAKEIVQGPTALAFGFNDPVNVAKAIAEYIRISRSPLAIRGAILDDGTLTPTQVSYLATLPPKEQLIAQLAAQAQAPLTRLVTQLQAPIQRLATILNGPQASLANLLHNRVEQLRSQSQSTQ